MARNLPFPGYSWPFTQHAIAIKAETIYSFLKCAAPFEGEMKGYDKKITALMIEAGILTANTRDGKQDAWRDYQQVLAELGLIYSTSVCPALTLTELGHMYLAGEIGFAELIGMQALRYQYPNGQKWVIQNRLRSELAAASIKCPEKFAELLVEKGVLIKPGSLIFRILIELAKLNADSSLTVSECLIHLLPCISNKDWPHALADILSSRHSSINSVNSINEYGRRNILDWIFLKLIRKKHYHLAITL
jgi:hypothetical protein